MQFDDTFFSSVGLAGATPEHKAELAAQLAATVQDRVAVRLSEILTDDQMTQFANLSDTQGETAAFAYLAEQYPDYPLLVQDELEAVKAEIAQDVSLVQARLNNPDAPPKA